MANIVLKLLIAAIVFWFIKPFLKRTGEIFAEKVFGSKNDSQTESPTVVIEMAGVYDENDEVATTKAEYPDDEKKH